MTGAPGSLHPGDSNPWRTRLLPVLSSATIASSTARPLHPQAPAITPPVLFKHVSPPRATGAPTSRSRETNRFAHDKSPRAHLFPSKPEMQQTRPPMPDPAFPIGSPDSFPDNNVRASPRSLAFLYSTPSPSARKAFESQRMPFSPRPELRASGWPTSFGRYWCESPYLAPTSAGIPFRAFGFRESRASRRRGLQHAWGRDGNLVPALPGVGRALPDATSSTALLSGGARPTRVFHRPTPVLHRSCREAFWLHGRRRGKSASVRLSARVLQPLCDAHPRSEAG